MEIYARIAWERVALLALLSSTFVVWTAMDFLPLSLDLRPNRKSVEEKIHLVLVVVVCLLQARVPAHSLLEQQLPLLFSVHLLHYLVSLRLSSSFASESLVNSSSKLGDTLKEDITKYVQI